MEAELEKLALTRSEANDELLSAIEEMRRKLDKGLSELAELRRDAESQIDSLVEGSREGSGR